jgi:glutamyl-tRNA reductase
MTLVLVGVNHRSAPLEVRERLAFPPAALGDALRRLCGTPPVREAVLLSTCNRTEVLALLDGGGPMAAAAIQAFLASERQFDAAELARIVYTFEGSEAVRHLFRLGVGLDSMILGEPQILGQLKAAAQTAAAAGCLGNGLGSLMQRSFSVSKRLRSETAIGRNPVSVSYAAVDLAQKIFGDLPACGVLLLGAGKTAELTARHLHGQGVRRIFVANRTFDRAERLARAFGGEAVPFDRFLEKLEQVEILISSTSSTVPVLRHEDAQRVIRRRRNRSLFLIDLAVPRDIEPSVNQIDNIYLYDLDDLQQVADSGLAERRTAAEGAERQITEEVAAYEHWCREREVGPTIVALRAKVFGMRDAEVERFRSRLQGAPPEARRAVEEITESLLNKLLHGPIQHLKRSAGDGGLDHVAMVREIFGLDPGGEEPPVARSAVAPGKEEPPG